MGFCGSQERRVFAAKLATAERRDAEPEELILPASWPSRPSPSSITSDRWAIRYDQTQQ
jgi:hypothetical protein